MFWLCSDWNFDWSAIASGLSAFAAFLSWRTANRVAKIEISAEQDRQNDAVRRRSATIILLAYELQRATLALVRARVKLERRTVAANDNARRYDAAVWDLAFVRTATLDRVALDTPLVDDDIAIVVLRAHTDWTNLRTLIPQLDGRPARASDGEVEPAADDLLAQVTNVAESFKEAYTAVWQRAGQGELIDIEQVVGRNPPA
jgi:hypothetical protein